MRTLRLVVILSLAVGLVGCKAEKAKETGNGSKDAKETEMAAGTFGGDVAFLKEHTEVVILTDGSGKGKLAVLPEIQGRAMTSSADGDEGLSYGWINRELFESGEFAEHINVYGGEDRFWIGPEGGQYSIFFQKDVPFDLEHWYTPAPIDTEAFELVSSTDDTAVLKKQMSLVNYSGTEFDLKVDREIRVLDKAEAVEKLGVTPGDGVKMVAFESVNKMTNTGEAAWTKEKGLLSIWILGMFNPSDSTTVAIPFVQGSEEELGPRVNDAYFGKVPAERLAIKDGMIYFSGDGKYRSKIGLTPQRAKPVLGSYDAENKVLTIVQYTKPEGATDYVNSMWELQDEPYAGDVVNSYNDGPSEPGAEPLGPFYELETSSPAAALEPGASISHTHRTIHLQGDVADLDKVSEAVLGVTTAEIEAGLGQ